MSVIEVELQGTGNNECTTNISAGSFWSNDETQTVGSDIVAFKE